MASLAYLVVVYLLAGGVWAALASGLVAPLSGFPLMVVGVGLAGLALAAVIDGRRGLRALAARVRRWRVGARWLAVLLVPPALVSTVLVVLGRAASPVFAPALFWPGLAFGVVAGFSEEIGWTGFAFPRLAARLGVLRASRWGSCGACGTRPLSITWARPVRTARRSRRSSWRSWPW